MKLISREIRSQVNFDGSLTLSIEKNELTEPNDDEIIVRVEATPVNPSDMALLLGTANLPYINVIDSDPGKKLTIKIPTENLDILSERKGKSLVVGYEGSGMVVDAGEKAKKYIGKHVGMFGTGMYSEYKKIKIENVEILPNNVSVDKGASMFINPLTALGFIETARNFGHKAIIHTPAASNLGQMLQRICLADEIPLINIVRSEEQVSILKDIGATYILNSKDNDFSKKLANSIDETKATIAFDAVGGGQQGMNILRTMEKIFSSKENLYNRYGSNVLKQLYIYGTLDSSPTILDRSGLGFSWSVSGWLLFNFLNKTPIDVINKMRSRVVNELTTTFPSHYTKTIKLVDLLQPSVLQEITKKSTGDKFLINPSIE